MIIDRLENRERYLGLSDDIITGLDHLAALDESVALGTYTLSDRVTVIVSTYKTEGPPFEGYEAHQKHIDIQYPIGGAERVLWSPLSDLKCICPYDETKDVGIWNDACQTTAVITGEGVFAIFFPDDAHRPCLPAGDIEEVIKKVTIKIRIP